MAAPELTLVRRATDVTDARPDVRELHSTSSSYAQSYAEVVRRLWLGYGTACHPTLLMHNGSESRVLEARRWARVHCSFFTFELVFTGGKGAAQTGTSLHFHSKISASAHDCMRQLDACMHRRRLLLLQRWSRVRYSGSHSQLCARRVRSISSRHSLNPPLPPLCPLCPLSPWHTPWLIIHRAPNSFLPSVLFPQRRPTDRLTHARTSPGPVRRPSASPGETNLQIRPGLPETTSSLYS